MEAINYERAYMFAAGAHAACEHTRKYSGEPYIVHPERVTSIVDQYTDDADIIAAALLHDVVEDTPITIAVISNFFGKDVAKYVEEVTDVTTLADGNRATRVAMNIERRSKISAGGQLITVADLIDNTSDIAKHAPREFARKYLAEKELLLEKMTLCDARLHELAVEHLKVVRKALYE